MNLCSDIKREHNNCDEEAQFTQNIPIEPVYRIILMMHYASNPREEWIQEMGDYMRLQMARAAHPSDQLIGRFVALKNRVAGNQL